MREPLNLAEIAVLGALLLHGMAPTAQAGDFFADGSKINLATARGSIVTASANSQGSHAAIVHHAYGVENRWSNNYGAGWWQIEFPEPYRVSSMKCGYYSQTNTIMVSVAYEIRVSTDGVNWTTVATHTGGVTAMPHDGMTSYYTLDAFPAVSAKYVRYAFSGHNGGEYGSPIPGSHHEMIINRVSIYGPDNLPVSTRFSLASSTWAGATAAYSDPWNTRLWTGSSNVTTIQAAPNVVDDFARLHNYWPNSDGLGQDVAVPPQPLAQEPTRFYITLNDTYAIHAVGWGSIADSRRAKDMDVYTSPDASGNNWVLQKSLVSLPNTGSPTAYGETTFSAPVNARRVRFDIHRVWNPTVHSLLRIADAYISELYVYGAPPAKSTVLSFEQ